MNEIVSSIADVVCIGFLSVPEAACADPRNLVVISWGMIATAFISLLGVLLIPSVPTPPKFTSRPGPRQSKR
jgi:hypothetical protein